MLVTLDKALNPALPPDSNPLLSVNAQYIDVTLFNPLQESGIAAKLVQPLNIPHMLVRLSSPSQEDGIEVSPELLNVSRNAVILLAPSHELIFFKLVNGSTQVENANS